MKIQILKNILILFSVFFIWQINSTAQIENQQVFYNDSSSYDVLFYKINLEASVDSKYLTGNTSVVAKVTNKNLKSFYIELNDSLTVDSIIIENNKQTFTHKNGWLKVFLKNDVTTGSLFNALIYYHGKGTSDTTFGGLEIDTAYSSKVLSVLSEPFSASVFFPCKQYLTDKADSVFIYITVPAGQVVVSNGLLKGKINKPGNKILYKWETRYPIGYYLIFFAISDYTEYSYRFYDPQYNDSVLFQNFIYKKPEFFASSKPNIDTTVHIFNLFEQLTGIAYPFRKEKYGHVTAPIGGGMENQTITMLVNFNFELVAHELGHSWFGNLVTCSDWQNIWINEGFASYMEYLALENIKPDRTTDWLKNALSQALTEPEGSTFIPENEKWNERRIFNGALSYKKGALILHMLRKKVNNDSLFFNIFKMFLEKFSYSNASANDFISVAKQVYGSGLNDFLQQWLYGRGYPVIQFYWSISGDSLIITTHYKGSSEITPIFNFDLEVLVNDETGKDSVVTLSIADTVQDFIYLFPKNIKSIIVNPYYNLLAKILSNPPIMNTITDIHNPAKNISVYPNPFTDTAKVIFDNESKKRIVEIFDLKGNKIGVWNNIGKEFVISSGMIKQGAYILNSSDEYGKDSVNIIKE